MAVHTLNDNLRIFAPKPDDDRLGYWNIITGEWSVYDDVDHALSMVDEAYRYEGLTLPLKDGDRVVEYWFVGGVTDEHFVLKVGKNDPTFIHLPAGSGTTYTVTITQEMRDKYGPDPIVKVETRLPSDPVGEWTDQMNNVYRGRDSDFTLLAINFRIDNLETLIIIK